MREGVGGVMNELAGCCFSCSRPLPNALEIPREFDSNEQYLEFMKLYHSPSCEWLAEMENGSE
jgi:hypothetical protein